MPTSGIKNNQESDRVWSSVKPRPERKSLGSHVYDQLQQLIANGDLSWGTRLVESQVAEKMDISRTPVREALHRLEIEGFITRSSTGGYYVSGLNRDDVLEIFGIRSVLESYAARLAARRRSQQEMDLLEERMAEYQQALDTGLLHELPEINTRFHDLFYSMSHSPRLIKMINDLKNQISRFRGFLLQNRDRAEISNQDHQKILEHIRRKDGDRVEEVMKAHILKGQELVIQEIDRQ